MIRNTLIALLLSGLGACSSIEQKGTISIEERGAKLLTERGDPILETGIYGQHGVSKDFATGKAKGIADETQREFWSMQDAQRYVHFILLKGKSPWFSEKGRKP